MIAVLFMSDNCSILSAFRSIRKKREGAFASWPGRLLYIRYTDGGGWYVRLPARPRSPRFSFSWPAKKPQKTKKNDALTCLRGLPTHTRCLCPLANPAVVATSVSLASASDPIRARAVACPPAPRGGVAHRRPFKPPISGTNSARFNQKRNPLIIRAHRTGMRKGPQHTPQPFLLFARESAFPSS